MDGMRESFLLVPTIPPNLARDKMWMVWARDLDGGWEGQEHERDNSGAAFVFQC